MFDIGASELLLIAVVALIVLGPERLPRVVRAAGFWLGRARRALLTVKEEIDREMKAEELREMLRRQAASKPLDRLIEDSLLKSPPTSGHTPPPSGDAAPAASGTAASPEPPPKRP